ncbi:MAG: CPBP family intramembrane metalloprotease [Lachnospiraceae bacterium]|nr:CPBP family intramembrane metalloprotease [Lachnospiraceae bacterium]
MKYDSKKWFILPMRCFLFIAAFSFCSMITRQDLTELTHWWTMLASIINIITISVLWFLCRRGNTTYLEMIHYEKRPKSIFKGFLFIVIMLLIGMGGMYFAGGLCYGEFPYLAPMMIAPISPYLALFNIVMLPLTTTIAEDGVYLGYGVNGFTSKWAAVFIPAFFYALQHSFIPMIFDLRFMTYRFLSFFPLTIWICFQYRKKGTVAYIMAGHWVLNLATTIQIAIMSFHPPA